LERSQDATAGTDLGRLRHRGPGRLCGAGRAGVSTPTPLSPARRSWSWSTPSNQRAGSSTCRYTTRWRWFGYGRSSWQVAVQPGCSAAVCHSRSQGPMNQRPQPWIGQPHGNHGWPGSWRASRVFGWTWWTSRHGMQISTVHRPRPHWRARSRSRRMNSAAHSAPPCSDWCSRGYPANRPLGMTVREMLRQHSTSLGTRRCWRSRCGPNVDQATTVIPAIPRVSMPACFGMGACLDRLVKVLRVDRVPLVECVA
jgi:hypothetical protein